MNYSLKLAGVISAILLVAMGGCATKRQPQAIIPVSAPAGLDAIPGAPAATEADAQPAASIPSEERLDYGRVVVPPLRPGNDVVSNNSEHETVPVSPAHPVPTRNPRPATGGTSRNPDPEAPSEVESPKPADAKAPALRPLLSSADRRQLETQIQANLERFRKNLALIRMARLGQNERNAFEEARSFAARADQLKSADPVLANSLAERAAILTQEILRKQ